MDQGPLGGQGLGGAVGLDPGGPVGAAYRHVGHGHLLQVLGIDGLAAVLGDLLGDHQVAPVHAGAEPVHGGVEQAGGALLKDGHREDQAVSLKHFVGEPLHVVLQDAGVAPAGEQAHDAGLAAGAVLDVQGVDVDELDLSAHLLGAHQGLFDHGVVAAVERAVGNTENFHLGFLL